MPQAKLRSLADAHAGSAGSADATAQGPALAHCAERGLEVGLTDMGELWIYCDIVQGLVTVPFWEYWTSPYSIIVAIIDHIPNGWVMFNGDI